MFTLPSRTHRIHLALRTLGFALALVAVLGLALGRVGARSASADGGAPLCVNPGGAITTCGAPSIVGVPSCLDITPAGVVDNCTLELGNGMVIGCVQFTASGSEDLCGLTPGDPAVGGTAGVPISACLTTAAAGVSDTCTIQVAGFTVACQQFTTTGPVDVCGLSSQALPADTQTVGEPLVIPFPAGLN